MDSCSKSTYDGSAGSVIYLVVISLILKCVIGIYLLGSWYSLMVGPWSVRYNGGKPSRSLRKYHPPY